MKNKNFFTLLLAILVAGSVATLLYSFKPVKQKNIGLQLYSIRDSIRKNIPAAIEKVAKMGYKFVEPAGYANGKIYDMDPVAFKELCQKNGMFVLSAHVSHPLPNEATWDQAMAWWDQCIDAHVAAGAKYLVQPTMGGDAYSSLEILKKYCEYFNAVGAKCNAKGLRFGYHNHDKEFSTQLEGQTIYDFMLANTDPAKVFFQLDLYWCVEGGKNPVDYFNKYPGRFELWHIKDREEIGASCSMDFYSIWAAAKISGMKYGIVEVERYNFDQFTSCKKSIDFLNEAKYVKMPKNK
ncbi:MAG: TIM barrel protein [Bacteroidia bacterium]|nr:TIM barrel protein [Bacteroidia bacterium]